MYHRDARGAQSRITEQKKNLIRVFDEIVADLVQEQIGSGEKTSFRDIREMLEAAQDEIYGSIEEWVNAEMERE